MIEIHWTEQATDQLRGAYDFIADSSPPAAENQVATVFSAVEQLSSFPAMGRTGRVHGTRELVVTGTPLLVAYRFRNRQIEILAVPHGARRWPRHFAR